MSEIEDKLIVEAYFSVLSQINQAKQPTGAVNLVAVSKTFPRASIEPVLKNGHRIFGENKVQEAQSKWIELKREYSDCEIHMIGPLQTNKAKDAVELFDVIQTLDRQKLAKILAKEMAKQKKRVNLFIQVNTGNESQKAGVAVSELPEFFVYCKKDLNLPIIGLMCIPPQAEDAAIHFAMLKELADQLGLPNLSMGMSSDFETAIKCGANYVRVGSAIFGRR